MIAPLPIDSLSLADWAQWYASQGWPVFPCHTPTAEWGCSCSKGRTCPSPGKHGRTLHGHRDASTDPQQIATWWQQWPDANIGCALTDSLWALDVDPRHGGDTTLYELERSYAELPPTLTSHTGGGGLHLLWCSQAPIRNKAPAGEGLDIQGPGSLIILPPSLHASGQRYCWDVVHGPDDIAPQAAPAWLDALVRASARPGAGAPAPSNGHSPQYTRLRSAIFALTDYDDYDAWLTVGMALHASELTWSRALWDEWSAQSIKYDAMAQDEKWASFHADGQTTLATLIYRAKQAGWVDPQARSSDPFAAGRSAPPARPVAPAATAVPEESYPYSDAYNAYELVKAHKAMLRYCAAWKQWLTWSETHWQRDTTGTVLRLQRQVVLDMGATLSDMQEDSGRRLLKHISASLNTARLKAAVEQAQSWAGVTVAAEVFDADPWLLNCRNGTVDLHTGQLRPHAREDLLTKVLTIAYDPAATCPAWLAFLWRIMGGTMTPDSPDMSAAELESRQAADDRANALMAFLQRALGYALTGSTREQCLFILHGPTKTGKSTFLAVLRALVGPYGQQADVASFMKKDREEIRNDLADLAGSRVVCALESQEGQRLSEALVKQLTGGTDQIKARFLFQEHFTYIPQFKIFLGTNHKPVIRDTDAAIWERIRLVPFTVHIPPQERDKGLETRLLAELPGILAWAVQGCLVWQQLGTLQEPDAVLEAGATYREESDVLGGFLAERCVLSPQVRAKASSLYKAYQDWCEENGERYPLAQRTFGLQLSERGLQRHRGTGNSHWWLGIGLSSDP